MYICTYVCICIYIDIHVYTYQYILTIYILTNVNLLDLNNNQVMFFSVSDYKNNRFFCQQHPETK